jgi:hypothetical protein
MMSKKGLASLLSISMLAALPGCCGWTGCGKDRDKEKKHHKKTEKTTRTDGNGYRRTTKMMDEEEK